MSQLALLLGFALAKVALAGAIVWLGFRGVERQDDEGWRRGGDPAPRVPPGPRAWRRGRVKSWRDRGPDRFPRRRAERASAR